MAAPLFSQTVDKVDRAVARLHELHCTITGNNACAGATGSPRRTRNNKPKRKPQQKSFQELVEMPVDTIDQPLETSDEWRRWSSPAEFVHQALSEILTASNYAKEVAGMVAESIESREVLKKKAQQNSRKKIIPRETSRVVERTGLNNTHRLQTRILSLENQENGRLNGQRVEMKQVNGQLIVPQDRLHGNGKRNDRVKIPEADHPRGRVPIHEASSENKENGRLNGHRVEMKQVNRQLIAAQDRIHGNGKRNDRVKIHEADHPRGKVQIDAADQIRRVAVRRREVLEAGQISVGLINRATPKAVHRLKVVTPISSSQVDPEKNLKPRSPIVRGQVAPACSLSSCSSFDSKKVQVATSSSSDLSSYLEKQQGVWKKKSEADHQKSAVQQRMSYAAPKKINSRVVSSLAQSLQPSLTPKIPRMVHSSYRSAKVSASPEETQVAIADMPSKFSVRVAEVVTAHRPWSLTPSKPSKPVIMFPNQTFALSTTPPKPKKIKPSKILQAPVSNISKVKNLSPLRSLKIQPSKSVKITPSKNVKLKSPSMKSPRQVGSLGKKQGWLSRRFSLLGKQDCSPVKPLPSLITRLPSRRRGPSTLECLLEPTASSKCIPSVVRDPIKTIPNPANFEPAIMSPLPVPPAYRAEGLRATQVKCTSLHCKENRKPSHKRSLSCPRQRPPLDENFIPASPEKGRPSSCTGKENDLFNIFSNGGKMEMGNFELKDCALPFPGCGSSVWPALRRSWSFGNESGAFNSRKANAGPSFLKHVKGWMRPVKQIDRESLVKQETRRVHAV